MAEIDAINSGIMWLGLVIELVGSITEHYTLERFDPWTE
jgi:hypothetical protein